MVAEEPTHTAFSPLMRSHKSSLPAQRTVPFEEACLRSHNEGRNGSHQDGHIPLSITPTKAIARQKQQAEYPTWPATLPQG